MDHYHGQANAMTESGRLESANLTEMQCQMKNSYHPNHSSINQQVAKKIKIERVALRLPRRC
ncbi:hypothetical protein KUTeg_012242 [Tegillarca granosa]|uniref:Uncharacterized protein n=1 Tax=Tegillarca granosa TaxID=220873 RepID=A0ABQ9F3A5_TEGGR|nr:hypothetical protein KUTeg_012242 [Tegillarca granosa]